jgi:hypothetical protein
LDCSVCQDNFDYAKHLTSRFRYSPFIANMCEDEYNAEASTAPTLFPSVRPDSGLLLDPSRDPCCW